MRRTGRVGQLSARCPAAARAGACAPLPEYLWEEMRCVLAGLHSARQVRKGSMNLWGSPLASVPVVGHVELAISSGAVCDWSSGRFAIFCTTPRTRSQHDAKSKERQHSPSGRHGGITTIQGGGMQRHASRPLDRRWCIVCHSPFR